MSKIQTTLLSDCNDFLASGLCVIPLRLDGSKAPTVRWKEYQTRLPSQGEIETWFTSSAGVAVVCGVVSGGLEILDFDIDAETIFPKWSKLVDPTLANLPVVKTPSGGYHVYYRCKSVCGNQKIAMLNDGVLIESRGQGGYVTTILSPPKVHARHCEYVQVAGAALPEVPTITPKQRTALWNAALLFDRSGILKNRCAAITQRRSSLRHVKYVSDATNIKSARKYVSKMEPAISGANGHNQTYKVACVLIQKFELDHDQALLVLREFNDRCIPKWTEKELRHKIMSASRIK